MSAGVDETAFRCEARDCHDDAIETLRDGSAFCAACLPMAKRCRDESTRDGYQTWLHSSPAARARTFQ